MIFKHVFLMEIVYLILCYVLLETHSFHLHLFEFTYGKMHQPLCMCRLWHLEHRALTSFRHLYRSIKNRLSVCMSTRKLMCVYS